MSGSLARSPSPRRALRHAAAGALALAVAALLAAPGLAAAQYDPRSPPPYPPPPPPPGYSGQHHRDRGVPDQGLTLGLRLGVGFAGGDISNDLDNAGNRIDPALGDLVKDKIPVWLELGYRFSPMVRGNVYLELAPVRVDRSFCDVAAAGSCDNGSNVRFGVALELHPAPWSPLGPWLGLGIGVERLEVDAFDATAGQNSRFTYTGWEFPLLEGGLDLALAPRFTLGPYLAWSLGRYDHVNVETPGFADVSDSIHREATHSWFQVGVRAVFKL